MTRDELLEGLTDDERAVYAAEWAHRWEERVGILEADGWRPMAARGEATDQCRRLEERQTRAEVLAMVRGEE